MSNLEYILSLDPFSLGATKKKQLLNNIFYDLSKFHDSHCEAYHKILNIQKFTIDDNYDYTKTPPLPVRLFKKYDLLSVDKNDIVKTMTSSGTSGQQVSKIYLDKKTASFQIKVLSKILSNFIGTKRLPMLIIDSKSILKDRKKFSARAAGILGFSMFGKDISYALDEKMNIDFKSIEIFLDKHKENDILVFGFTSIVWKYFYKSLKKENKYLNIENGILLHGGGWKKLQNQAVDNNTYKEEIKSYTKINKIYNYYGMIEQTGSIFMECEAGHLHCSNFSDISILDKHLKPLGPNQKGLIELYSTIPHSYPGHILLSEDYGELLGEDDCPCKRMGKYFKIHGRIKKAEIRGCSDTYEKY